MLSRKCYNILMKIIFGLGNPGLQYTNTRHNIGFFVLEKIAQTYNATYQPKTKFLADIAECNINNEKVLLVKPQTFYNETGKSAQALIDFYKLSIDDILIIHDDIALEFGKIRVRQGGQDAGNNGLKSLHRHIGDNFWHIRIGVNDVVRRQIGDTDFVLGKFNNNQLIILGDWVAPTAIKLVEQFITNKLEPTSYKSSIDKTP